MNDVNSDATSENISRIMTELLKQRYCRQSDSDYNACAANFFFQSHSNSFIEQSLLRRANQKCLPFRQALQTCLSNPSNQDTLLRSAVKVPQCRTQRAQLEKCQRTKSKSGCEEEAQALVFCGLSYKLLSEVPPSASHPLNVAIE